MFATCASAAPGGASSQGGQRVRRSGSRWHRVVSAWGSKGWCAAWGGFPLGGRWLESCGRIACGHVGVGGSGEEAELIAVHEGVVAEVEFEPGALGEPF